MAQARERELQRAAEELRRALRLEACENLHVALSLQREVLQGLDEVHMARGDEEPYWEFLSVLADYVRDCDRDYCHAAELEYHG
jgi:hypothetical protein